MNNRKIYRLSKGIVCLFIFVLGHSSMASAFEVNSLFSNHMVLQRHQPIKVFGEGEAGEKIIVQLTNEKQQTIVDKSGKWEIELPSREAESNSLVLTISNGVKELKFTDVVIGDVWVCSGQSNMGWVLKNTLPSPQDFLHSDKLRLLRGEEATSSIEPLDNFPRNQTYYKNGWERAVEKHAIDISAVSYFMGLELVKKLDIPVGIVVVALGGSQIWPWMTAESIKGHKEEEMAIESSEKAIKWSRTRAKELRFEGDSAKASKLLHSYKAKAPSTLYNGMIHPLTKTAIAGMLWYQGERSQDNPLPYRTLFPSAINGWRDAWQQGDFPFVYIQLPAYFGADERTINRAKGFPFVREAQEMALILPNTGMVVSLEYGNYQSVHPVDKREVGRRAALQAMKLLGGDVVADGPVKKEIKLEGDRAIIYFTSIQKGLEKRTVVLARNKKKYAADDNNPIVVDGKTLQGFEICGEDGVFSPANAKIIGKNKVEVTSKDKTPIVNIRYAFLPFPECNLFNSEGLPARPFRTDNFKPQFVID